MNRFYLAPLVAAMLAGPVGAATLIINPITATWSNVVGGTGVTFSGNGTADAGVRWGDPATGAGKSGYQFTAAAVPLVTNFVVDGAGSSFNLGAFRHINQPIFAGSSITGARLTVTYGIEVASNNLGTRNAVFDFSHWETDNGASPCADGGANGVGVNVNGCADRVIFSLNSAASSFFTIDDIDYTLNLTSFEVGGNPVSQFWTVEGADNRAFLLGNISARSVVDPGGGAVPEPASWAMMLMGFGAVGLTTRRKRRAVVAA
jgi:hypothetical protein